MESTTNTSLKNMNNMKMKHVIALFLFVAAGGFSLNASAQQSIYDLIKKCETMPDIDMSTVQDNSEQNGQRVGNTIITVTIRNNPELIRQFQAAFEREKTNASRTIENRRNGVVSPTYTFEADGKSIVCTLKLREEDSATVSYIENRGSRGGTRVGVGIGQFDFNFPHDQFAFHFDSGKWDDLRDNFGQLLDSVKFDEFSKEIEEGAQRIIRRLQ